MVTCGTVTVPLYTSTPLPLLTLHYIGEEGWGLDRWWSPGQYGGGGVNWGIGQVSGSSRRS